MLRLLAVLREHLEFRYNLSIDARNRKICDFDVGGWDYVPALYQVTQLYCSDSHGSECGTDY